MGYELECEEGSIAGVEPHGGRGGMAPKILPTIVYEQTKREFCY